MDLKLREFLRAREARVKVFYLLLFFTCVYFVSFVFFILSVRLMSLSREEEYFINGIYRKKKVQRVVSPARCENNLQHK